MRRRGPTKVIIWLFLFSIPSTIWTQYGSEANRLKHSVTVGKELSTGTVTCLAIDPKDPSVTYVGSIERKGLIKTTDGGQSWLELSSNLRGLLVKVLVFDPQDLNTMYVGTNNGVFKSTSGGSDWIEKSKKLRDRHILALVIDPNQPSVLYAGTSFNGVFKTTNGGNDWFESNIGLTHPGIATLAIDTNDSNIIYAGTRQGAVFKSLSKGESWTETELTHTQVESLAVDPKNPQVLYVGTSSHGIFKSTSGGTHWSKVIGSPSGPYNDTLAIDPNDPKIVYAGARASSKLYKTTDAGKTWFEINSGLIGQTVSAIAIHPRDSSTIYVGTRLGVFKSTNAGETWTAITKIPRPRRFEAPDLNSAESLKEETLTDQEKTALSHAAQRFTSELQSKNDFAAVFDDRFFVDGFFDHPGRFGAYQLGLDDTLLAEVDKGLIKRYVIAHLNLFLHMLIYHFSKISPDSQPDLSDMIKEFPESAESYIKENGIKKKDLLGSGEAIENSAALIKRLRHIEAVDQRFKHEVERQSLTTSTNYQHWLKALQAIVLQQFQPSKEIVRNSYMGYAAGTTLYTTIDFFYVLRFIKQNDQWKIAALELMSK